MSGFGEFQGKTRKRPVGICSECGHEKRLRQLKPSRLCGACYMRAHREEESGSDPARKDRDAVIVRNRVMRGITTIITTYNSIEDLIDAESARDIVKSNERDLRPLVDGLSRRLGNGHGHNGGERDRDQEAEAAPAPLALCEHCDRPSIGAFTSNNGVEEQLCRSHHDAAEKIKEAERVQQGVSEDLRKKGSTA